MDRVLIVKLGALGDIVHALPTAAALRDAAPSIRISWLVDHRNRAILDLADGIDDVVLLGGAGGAMTAAIGESSTPNPQPPTPSAANQPSEGQPRTRGPFGWGGVIGWLRAQRFDVALDLQG